MHHLEGYACNNRLRQVSPQQKLLFAIAVLLIAFIGHPVTQGVIVLWMGMWTIGYARIPPGVYLRVLLVAGVFFLISVPALVVNGIPAEHIAGVYQDRLGGVAVGNWYLYISHQGLVQALRIGLRSVACTSCLVFVLFTIPFTDLLQVLRQWRVPPVLTELLLLMYRFIFLFLSVIAELQLAQRARGGYRTRQRWMVSVGLLVSQLLVRSLQHYHHFSLAVASRGFNGNFQVYSTQSYGDSRRYAIEAFMGCVGLITLNLTL